MQQSNNFQSVLEAFASDLQEYIKIEVRNQVDSALKNLPTTPNVKPIIPEVVVDSVSNLHETVLNDVPKRLEDVSPIDVKQVKIEAPAVHHTQKDENTYTQGFAGLEKLLNKVKNKGY